MPLKIVRNDITKMETEAIVNTANQNAVVGPGCDRAVYNAAGYEELLQYRTEKIGFVEEGEAFITPGFNLRAKYIIHAVSPLYTTGEQGEESRLRSCYRKSLRLAKENGIRSIAFPLISTGSFGYPKEEGLRIAVDEINAFLLSSEMEIFLVVFGERAVSLGKKIDPGLQSYIDQNYVEGAREEEYGFPSLSMKPENFGADRRVKSAAPDMAVLRRVQQQILDEIERNAPAPPQAGESAERRAPASAPVGAVSGAPKRRSPFRSVFKSRKSEEVVPQAGDADEAFGMEEPCEEEVCADFAEQHEERLEERIHHMSDTYSEYLMYLIQQKKMENAEVWKRAIVDKKVFSKIKNNVNYHPNKRTALCLCIGLKLNLDEAKDLLARAGYALSPCDKTDIIFSYFIENEIYDMIELDIQLEEHGLPCIIS